MSFIQSFEKVAVSLRKIEQMIDSGVMKRLNETAFKRMNEGANAVKNAYGKRGSDMLLRARAEFSPAGKAMVTAARNESANFNYRSLSKKDRNLYRQFIRGRQILHPKTSKLPIHERDARAGISRPVNKLKSGSRKRSAPRSYQLNLFRHGRKD